ncbi:hypothetical protein LIPSTDRAFT_69104 [Lipomyces starkeyi NRRL Y-11557]|uniref:Uncharacterized protein n=1 Tax=Lipomyces starkeyi NRRL Y-11557 TaxID=675824 RepID=A0A1E3QBG3_LIPST|nr:hypothetical protein LIPSTDRAFT_69104 [Lipomyces starkeyi NRRL Y-11557]
MAGECVIPRPTLPSLPFILELYAENIEFFCAGRLLRSYYSIGIESLNSMHTAHRLSGSLCACEN